VDAAPCGFIAMRILRHAGLSPSGFIAMQIGAESACRSITNELTTHMAYQLL